MLCPFSFFIFKAHKKFLNVEYIQHSIRDAAGLLRQLLKQKDKRQANLAGDSLCVSFFDTNQNEAGLMR